MTEPGQTVSWRELWAETELRLAAAELDGGSGLETRWLIAEAAGFDDADLILRLDEAVTERAMARFDDMVGRRLAGEPLQYVLGHWPFRGLDVLVDRRALIPRPETEALVDVALAAFDCIGGRDRTCRVIDLGTGTGVIGLSIAAERPRARVVLVERSEVAAEVARANLAGTGRVGVRVDLLVGDWFDPLDPSWLGDVDLIVSNPPYVATGDDLPMSVAGWEPVEALCSGEDGLDDLRRIIGGASRWLRPGGYLVLEHGASQQSAVAAICEAVGFRVEGHRDPAGRDRFVVASLGGTGTPE